MTDRYCSENICAFYALTSMATDYKYNYFCEINKECLQDRLQWTRVFLFLTMYGPSVGSTPPSNQYPPGVLFF
jgi:hypothetical protein